MEKISENGAYKELPMEFYHGDCCVGPSVSSTVLRAVEQKSERHGWLKSPLNPDRGKDGKTTTPLRIGSAVHSLAFDKDGLDPRWFVKSPFDEFRTNEAKRWRDLQINAGKTILKQSEFDLIRDITDALLEEPVIQQGLFDERGEIETSLIYQDEETGLWLKSRPDVVPVNPIITDLKVVADASRRAVEYSIMDNGYHMQLGLAAEIMERLLGNKIEEFWLILVEKEPPHPVTFAEISMDLIAWGRVLNRSAIRRFAQCVKKGVDKTNFPKDLREKEMAIDTPAWYHASLTRRQESGELPSVMEACGPFSFGE